MEKIFYTFGKILKSDEFLWFQNDIATDIYDELGRGYNSNENEVSLVTNLVKATNNKSFGPIRTYSEKIHGSRSYVKFNYMDKPVTKELGDMAIISLITRGKKRIYQKLCIVQNKKESGNGWNIDIEQLYMLKNFPPFSENTGIFSGMKDIIFRNNSGCLGAFGFFDTPGELSIISGPMVSELRKGKKSVSRADVSVPEECHISKKLNNGNSSSPFQSILPSRYFEEYLYALEKITYKTSKYGYPYLFPSLPNLPFLHNSCFLRDVHDFTRGWTQFNIGEVTFAFGETLNPSVDGFCNLLLRSTGISEYILVPADDHFSNMKFNYEMGVLVVHLDLDSKF